MSFSFYTGNFDDDQNGGVNSAGESLTGNARNTMTLPPFKAPAEEGTYRIRFKMDWNSVDPGGQIAADGTCTGANGFLANRGSIVDATLVVSATTGIDGVIANGKNAELFDQHCASKGCLHSEWQEGGEIVQSHFSPKKLKQRKAFAF